jgi:hypothetical protein
MQAFFSVDPEKDVELQRHHIIMMAPTLDKMEKHYLQTTSGLTLAG